MYHHGPVHYKPMTTYPIALAFYIAHTPHCLLAMLWVELSEKQFADMIGGDFMC